MVYAKFGEENRVIVGDSTIEYEIPGELSRENMISSPVKKKHAIFTCEKITVAMST